MISITVLFGIITSVSLGHENNAEKEAAENEYGKMPTITCQFPTGTTAMPPMDEFNFKRHIDAGLSQKGKATHWGVPDLTDFCNMAFCSHGGTENINWDNHERSVKDGRLLGPAEDLCLGYVLKQRCDEQKKLQKDNGQTLTLECFLAEQDLSGVKVYLKSDLIGQLPTMRRRIYEKYVRQAGPLCDAWRFKNGNCDLSAVYEQKVRVRMESESEDPENLNAPVSCERLISPSNHIRDFADRAGMTVGVPQWLFPILDCTLHEGQTAHELHVDTEARKMRIHFMQEVFTTVENSMLGDQSKWLHTAMQVFHPAIKAEEANDGNRVPETENIGQDDLKKEKELEKHHGKKEKDAEEGQTSLVEEGGEKEDTKKGEPDGEKEKEEKKEDEIEEGLERIEKFIHNYSADAKFLRDATQPSIFPKSIEAWNFQVAEPLISKYEKKLEDVIARTVKKKADDVFVEIKEHEPHKQETDPFEHTKEEEDIEKEKEEEDEEKIDYIPPELVTTTKFRAYLTHPPLWAFEFWRLLNPANLSRNGAQQKVTSEYCAKLRMAVEDYRAPMSLINEIPKYTSPEFYGLLGVCSQANVFARMAATRASLEFAKHPLQPMSAHSSSTTTTTTTNAAEINAHEEKSLEEQPNLQLLDSEAKVDNRSPTLKIMMMYLLF